MSVDYSKFLYLALLGKETGQKKLEFYTFLRFDSHAFKTLSDWWDNQFTIANQNICSSEDETKSNTCFSSVLFK